MGDFLHTLFPQINEEISLDHDKVNYHQEFTEEDINLAEVPVIKTTGSLGQYRSRAPYGEVQIQCDNHQYHVGLDPLGTLALLTSQQPEIKALSNPKEELKSVTLRTSMEEEYKVHIKKEALVLVNFEPVMNVIGSTWTY